jgi:malonate transporter and related proteins
MTAIIQDIASVFAVLALGYFSGKRSMFTHDQAEGLNRLVLNYCLPAMLFLSIARGPPPEMHAGPAPPGRPRQRPLRRA